jgi:hypothetical protein
VSWIFQTIVTRTHAQRTQARAHTTHTHTHTHKHTRLTRRHTPTDAHAHAEDDELTRLAELGLKVRKTGTRDLPLLLSGIGDGNGATTVSATMWLVGLFCMY